MERKEGDVRRPADLDHAGADHAVPAALGADLFEIRLGLADGIDRVRRVRGKCAARIRDRRRIAEEEIDQRDLVSALSQRPRSTRSGADGNVALGAESAADNGYVHEAFLP